ncbi:MAG: glucosaminidase domain-containing protein [Colwellia sp.]|nr:glucosaminidase domain-containing protein [Colwellia sp.]
MKSSLIIKILLVSGLLIGLIAPFTFQKLNSPKKIIVEKQVKVVKPAKVIEKPLHLVILPDFAKIRDIKQKKKQFFNFIRPAVEQENQKVLDNREQLKHWLAKVSLEEALTEQEEKDLTVLIKTYKVSKQYSLLQQLNELLVRVDIIPVPLVLVQAANESAWGTSRFARIGLNFFGIWCYRQGCGMVPSGRDDGAKHEVAAYNSVNASVRHYLYNINTNNAYIVFRAIRAQLRAQNQLLQPEVLATGLLPYSQRGTDYVLEITQMIRHNSSFFNTVSIPAD